MKARTQKGNAGQGICDSTRNPYGGVEFVRCTESLVSKREKLLEKMLSRENMLTAWKRVKANRGASGVDGISIGEFPEFIRTHWDDIKAKVERGDYKPMPVRRTEIPKGNGETRPLGIPTVLDRLIQQALAQVLVPIFEPLFSEYSYGFRPRRSAHEAVCRIRDGIKSNKRWAVDIDLSKFFDRVDHDLLMTKVSGVIKDRRILRLIGRFLRSGVMVDGLLQPTRLGVPQGGPLSPLLANIMLNDLDKEMESRGYYFARYADDFVILAGSRKAGQRMMESLKHFIETRLKLQINEQKSRIVPSTQAKFLGFTFTRKTIRWTAESFADFKHRIRELTSRKWGVSFEHRLEALNRYLRGWMGYFRLSYYYRPLPELDTWIRRRLRMCLWKQWRRVHTKVRMLMKLGVSRAQAIQTGSSNKQYWRLSKTLATNWGMGLKWFESKLEFRHF